MRTSLPALCLGLGLASIAACSIVNAPDEPVDPQTTSSSSTGGMGGMGGMDEIGGMGGMGGSPAVCGNMTVEGTEECDDGMETADCNADCTTAACADGVVNRAAGEQCDDGNTNAGDTCSPSCQATPFTVDPMVGQGLAAIQGPLGSMVTRDGDGNENFGVVWSRFNTASTGYAAFTSVYAPDGQPLLTDLPVSSTDDGRGMSVAYNSQGRGVAVWRSTGAAPELRFRVIDPGGMPANAAQAVLSNAAPKHHPAVGSSPDGGFCIAWIHDSDDIIRVRCMTNNGVLTGVNSSLEVASVSGNGSLFGPLSVIGIKNGYVVTYLNVMGEGRGQVIGLDGNKLGGPFALWDTGLNGHFGNGVGSTANAAFAVAAINRGPFGQMSDEDRAVVRRFQSAGNPSGPEMALGTEHREEVSPWITRPPGGGPSLVTWSRLVSVPPMPTGCELLMQRFDAQGQPIGTTTQVAVPPVGSCWIQGRPVSNSVGDVFVPYIEGNINGNTQGRVRAIIFRRLLE